MVSFAPKKKDKIQGNIQKYQFFSLSKTTNFFHIIQTLFFSFKISDLKTYKKIQQIKKKHKIYLKYIHPIFLKEKIKFRFLKKKIDIFERIPKIYNMILLHFFRPHHRFNMIVASKIHVQLFLSKIFKPLLLKI